MKHRSSLSLTLIASLLLAGAACGQNKSATAATPPLAATPAAKQQKLVKIATLNTAEANREFQANVQVMQAQRQKAVELNAAMEKEKDAKKKAELKTQLDQAMAKLNEDNDKMQKAYGFSLARNYTMVIETAHIYMLVTDEEAAVIEKAEKEAAAKAKK